MKSHRKYRFWFISLATHLCLAIAFSFITINRNPTDVDTIDVSILEVEPLPIPQRMPRVETPVVAAKPVADFQIKPQVASTQTRSIKTHQVKSALASAPEAAAVDDSVSSARSAGFKRSQIPPRGVRKVALSSSVSHRSIEPLSTAADLPVQSDAPLAAGLSGGSSLSNAIGEGSGSGFGKGVRRRAYGSGDGVGQTPVRTRVGLTSLVAAEGTANIDDALSDVADKVALGNGIPELPERTPGAIVVGRGRDIIGQLNLVRFEDPLHPHSDLCNSGISNLRFGAGMSYLVQSLNERTQIKTQLVDSVAMTDAAFFESPIIFMEPVSGSAVKHSHGHKGGHITATNPIWQISRPRGTHDYTDKEVQRLREYVVNRGGFIYLLTHGNTEGALRPAQRVLRQILPEHQLTYLPNEHPIYNAYYGLNGPLRYPVRKIGKTMLHHGPYSKLRGISIDGRLAVLVDTEAMLHVIDGAIQKPFFGMHAGQNRVMEEFAPHAARQLINVVVYAITHGNISDYSNYIPETALKGSGDEDLHKKAPNVTQKL